MKAVCFHNKHDVRVDNVPDPKIQEPGDCIIRITSTAICGSDLHLFDGLVATLERGDILGHEMMGEVVEIGPDVKNLKIGDRVVVPFTISCGSCWFCSRDMYSLCDTTNPNAEMAAELYGHSPAGLFGFSHLYGGYAGGQAEYARIPHADVGPIKIPDGLEDDKVLFLSDIFPTGYMAVENCDIKGGETVAIWGAGPVAQFAIKSAQMMGAAQVIAIDNIPERLAMATENGAIALNFDDVDLQEKLKEMTEGRGPDACIDAVGMEAHGTEVGNIYDYAKQALRMSVDRPNVVRQAIQACRKGGTISVPGVYAGFFDKIPFGSSFNKGLTWKMGQTHVQKYMPRLLERVQNGDIDPSFVITHRLPLEEAAFGYDIFRNKKDNCIKIVLKPGTA